jgi:hypothetical protein
MAWSFVHGDPSDLGASAVQSFGVWFRLQETGENHGKTMEKPWENLVDVHCNQSHELSEIRGSILMDFQVLWQMDFNGCSIGFMRDSH